MASDAHAHPWNLQQIDSRQEELRRRLHVSVLASSCQAEELNYHLQLRKRAMAEESAPLYVAFGIHPQLILDRPQTIERSQRTLLWALEKGLLQAIGEVGLDALGAYKESLKKQEELFALQLDLAIEYRLPLVLHLRKGQAALYPFAKNLARIPALIVHSSPLNYRESCQLLDRGINAFFSFGSPVLKGKKSALQALEFLPIDRILIESDAPWQGMGRGAYTDWNILKTIHQRAYELRPSAGEEFNIDEFEKIIDGNFRRALGV